jgi:hypothetical protein
MVNLVNVQLSLLTKILPSSARFQGGTTIFLTASVAWVAALHPAPLAEKPPVTNRRLWPDSGIHWEKDRINSAFAAVYASRSSLC